jgi:hypothetical protein
LSRIIVHDLTAKAQRHKEKKVRNEEDEKAAPLHIPQYAYPLHQQFI